MATPFGCKAWSPAQSSGILVVRNAQGDSRWQAPACALDVPDHCDHVVAE